MSGHKRATISISPEEYRKLHNAEMSMRFMNSNASGHTTAERQDIQSHLLSGIEEMQARQQLLIETLNDIGLDFSNLEEQNSQMLLDHQNNLSQEITDLLSDLQMETDVALKSIEQQLMIELQKAIKEVNQSRAWMQEEWEHQANNHEQSIDIAHGWVQAAEALTQFIDLHYEHQRFTPGKLEQTVIQLQQAHQNLVQNLPQAAIAIAQSVYYNLSNLRIELEAHQNQYSLLHDQFNLGIQSFRQLVEANQEVPALDLEGKPIPYSITVDYWCEGQLSTLIEEFEKTVAYVLENISSLDITDLRELIDIFLPTMEKRLSDLVFQARLKAINAQIRVNIAEIVVSSLSTQGYFLARSFFESNDERTTYQAILYNYEGSRIIVRIEPGSEQKGSNELHLLAKDRQTKTLHESRQRALEIQRALKVNGLLVGEITTINNELQSPPLLHRTLQPQVDNAERKKEISLGLR